MVKPGHRWLTLVILATLEAEIRRITVGSQPRQIVCETLSQKIPNTKKRTGRVAQVVERLPSKHKALSSNSTEKEREREREREKETW
jgi:hypothetical protein